MNNGPVNRRMLNKKLRMNAQARMKLPLRRADLTMLLLFRVTIDAHLCIDIGQIIFWVGAAAVNVQKPDTFCQMPVGNWTINSFVGLG